MLDTNPNAAHHLIASQIRTIYLMITKHPQNGSSKGISTLLLAAGPKGKFMKTQFGQLWRSSICQLFLFLFTARKILQFVSRTQQAIVETAYAEAICRQIRRANDSEKNGKV